LTQNHEKPLLGHHLKALFMLITMAQSPASYLIHIPRYNLIQNHENPWIWSNKLNFDPRSWKTMDYSLWSRL